MTPGEVSNYLRLDRRSSVAAASTAVSRAASGNQPGAQETATATTVRSRRTLTVAGKRAYNTSGQSQLQTNSPATEIKNTVFEAVGSAAPTVAALMGIFHHQAHERTIAGPVAGA